MRQSKIDAQLFVDNLELYHNYNERIVNLALSQFDWSGLPDTCDRLYFEKMLLYKGRAAMYLPAGLEDTDEFLSTDFLPGSGFDAYGYPLDIVGVTFNATNIQTNEWLILYDNMTKESLMPKIKLYAKLLWECHQIERSNLKQQNTPYIITTTRNEAQGFKVLFNRIFGFEPLVEVKNTFNPDEIKTLDLKVEFKGNELAEYKKKIWEDALATLGITAANPKKERMFTAEVVNNSMEQRFALNSRLLNRKEFCRKANEKWGLNLDVSLSCNYTEEEFLNGRIYDVDSGTAATVGA